MVLWLLSLSLVVYIIIKYVIVPFLILLSYKKQGIDCNMIPTFGHIFELKMNQKNHGDIFYKSKIMGKKNPNYLGEAFSIGSRVALHLMDPALIRDHLKKEDLCFRALPATARHFLGRGGLIVTKGELWKKNRKITWRSLNPDSQSKMIPMIEDAVMKGINRIKKAELKGKVILPELELIAGEINGQIFFGEDLNKYNFNGMPFSTAVIDILEQIGKITKSLPYQILGDKFFELGILPSHRKLIRDCKEFRHVILTLIQEKKKNTLFFTANDLCSLLLGTQGLQDPNMRFSDEEILDLFISLFFPGTQNISLAGQMLLYCIGKYQEFLPELKEEIANIYDKSVPLTYEALSSMDLLTGFIKEQFRFFVTSGGNLPRSAAKDHMVGNIMVKKNTIITIDPFYTFYHPKYFDAPEKFNPKRWLEKNDFEDTFVSLSFGEGPRVCIGQQLTWITLKILACEMIKAFDQIKVPGDYKLEMTIKRRTQPKNDARLDPSAVSTG